jgi:hypothetical protein
MVALCAVCAIMLVGNGAYLLTANFGSGLATWGGSAGTVRIHGALLLVSGVLAPLALGAWGLARLRGAAHPSRLEPILRWCLAGILVWDILLALITSV